MQQASFNSKTPGLELKNSAKFSSRHLAEPANIQIFIKMSAMHGHDHTLFDKLLWCLGSSPIFVCYQRLIARKIAKLFQLQSCCLTFYKVCGINDVSGGSVLRLFAASSGRAIFTTTTLFMCVKLPAKTYFGPFHGSPHHPPAAYLEVNLICQ
jgi:hypothetical protein